MTPISTGYSGQGDLRIEPERSQHIRRAPASDFRTRRYNRIEVLPKDSRPSVRNFRGRNPLLESEASCDHYPVAAQPGQVARREQHPGVDRLNLRAGAAGYSGCRGHRFRRAANRYPKAHPRARRRHRSRPRTCAQPGTRWRSASGLPSRILQWFSHSGLAPSAGLKPPKPVAVTISPESRHRGKR